MILEKTYYSEEANVDTFEEKHILAMRPSINLAKNIKQRDPVFALINHEVIEGMSSITESLSSYSHNIFFLKIYIVKMNVSIMDPKFLFYFQCTNQMV